MSNSFTRRLATLASAVALTAAEGLVYGQDIFGQKRTLPPDDKTTVWTVAERSKPVCENRGRHFEPNENGSCPDIRVSNYNLVNDGKPVVFTVKAARYLDGTNAIKGVADYKHVCVAIAGNRSAGYMAPRSVPCQAVPEIQEAMTRFSSPPSPAISPGVLWYLQQQQKQQK